MTGVVARRPTIFEIKTAMCTRSAKIIFLFCLYTGLQVSEACTDCNCPNTLPFFDYQSITLTSNGPVVGADNNLEIEVLPDSIGFLAQAGSASGFRFSTAAYGCDCNPDGDLGDKFPFFLNITSDKAFNDTLPAGASLNSVFFLNRGDVVYPMPEQEKTTFGLVNRPVRLFGMAKPVNLNDTYQFNIRLVKTSGDTLLADTGPIQFQ